MKHLLLAAIFSLSMSNCFSFNSDSADPTTICIVGWDGVYNTYVRQGMCSSGGQQWTEKDRTPFQLRIDGVKEREKRKEFVKVMKSRGYDKISEIHEFDILIKGGTVQRNPEVCLFDEYGRSNGVSQLTCSKNAKVTASFNSDEKVLELMKKNGFRNISNFKVKRRPQTLRLFIK